MIKHHPNLNALLDAYPNMFLEFDIDNKQHLDALSNETNQQILVNGGVLPQIPPFEKHPYLSNLALMNNITGIMIGTFPPISHLCDSLNLGHLVNTNGNISPPEIPYFHGNSPHVSLWNYCPMDFEAVMNTPRNQRANFISAQLNNQGILYTDIIAYCQRELRDNRYTADDARLYNIIVHKEVYKYLFESNIERIYFTNASIFGTSVALFKANGDYNLKQSGAFELFLKGAHNNGYKLDVCLPNNLPHWKNINEGLLPIAQRQALNQMMKSKIYSKLRLTKNNKSKVIDIVSCLSPAAVDRGTLRKNLCVQRYAVLNNISTAIAPEMLLRTVLNSFFNNTLEQLSALNI